MCVGESMPGGGGLGVSGRRDRQQNVNHGFSIMSFIII